MSDNTSPQNKNKRYYWLKLKNDFFLQPYIKKLRRIAGGDTYTIIYQKILLLSIKTNGYIVFQGIEKTFEEELSLILDEDVDNIKVTMSFMKANRLIEDDTESKDKFLLPAMINLIGSETQNTIRSRNFRESKKQQTLQRNADATQEQRIRNKNETPENRVKSIELDRDIDNNKSINNTDNGIYNNTTFAPSDSADAKSNSEHDHENKNSNPDAKNSQNPPSLKPNPKKKNSLPEINFNFETQRWEYITPEDCDIWKEAYPACDIRIELARAKAWLIANPHKRKKKYRIFINNWLINAQDRGGRTEIGGSKTRTWEYKSRTDLIHEKNLEAAKIVLERHAKTDAENQTDNKREEV